MLYAFFHGLILSTALILPLGPQNMFIFNQGATQPKLSNAMPVVLTAALCDTLLILASVLGVSVVLLTIPELQVFMYLAGFFFLIFIGWSIWKTEASPSESHQKPRSTKSQILFAVSVSLLNPHAVIDTVGVIGTNAAQYSDKIEQSAFALASILVSWIAFILLAVGGRFIKRIDQNGHILKVINKVSALTIWAIALTMVGQMVVLLR